MSMSHMARPGAARSAVLLLLLLTAAFLVAGCGEEEGSEGAERQETTAESDDAPDASKDTGISDVTSDPEEYVGATVELTGEAASIRNEFAFVLEESEPLQGDDLLVVMEVGEAIDGFGEGDEVEVIGKVALFDVAFREDFDEQVFDDATVDEFEGKAVVLASSASPVEEGGAADDE